MSEPSPSPAELRAAAGTLLRAQATGDRLSFERTLARYERAARPLFVTVCALANHALSTAFSPGEAQAIYEVAAAELPDPDVAAVTQDAWLDGIALLEALGRSDDLAARTLLVNTPDPTQLFGAFVQVVAELIAVLQLPQEFLADFAGAAREAGHPDVRGAADGQ